MGIFSNIFSRSKGLDNSNEKVEIKNQILQQPNANEVSDSYLNSTGNYRYNVETIPANDVDMSTAMAMDSPNFWNHKSNTKEDYMNLASKLPEVQEQLNSGKTLNEVKEDPELRDCARAYYDPDKMVRVRENDNGDYEFEDDGRHRVAAAQELGYDIPVQNLSQPVQEQTNDEGLDTNADGYTYNPSNEDYEKNAALEDEIAQNDNENDLSDGNHYMNEEEDNGYSHVKTMDGTGNNYTPSEEAEYNGFDSDVDQDTQQEQPENLDFEENGNDVPPENEQDSQEEQTENQDNQEEDGTNPENEQDSQQEQDESQDNQKENGTTPENEQDSQQEQDENQDNQEENGTTPENEQDSQQEQDENQDNQEENGTAPENEQDTQQEQPDQSEDNGQDADYSHSSDGPDYSDDNAGESMAEDSSMSV